MHHSYLLNCMLDMPLEDAFLFTARNICVLLSYFVFKCLLLQIYVFVSGGKPTGTFSIQKVVSVFVVIGYLPAYNPFLIDSVGSDSQNAIKIVMTLTRQLL